MSAANRVVYISYAWGGESERIVDELDADLQARGIAVVRDKRDLGYKGTIRDFMQQIGRGYAVIVVISDKYLRSANCMFELLEVARNADMHSRIFPVVLKDADIYDPVRRIAYVKHWEDQLKALDEAMRSVSAANLQGVREEIDSYDAIRDHVARLTFLLKDMNTLSPEVHENTNFSSLIASLERRMQEAGDAAASLPSTAKAEAAEAGADRSKSSESVTQPALGRALARLGASGVAFRRPRLESELAGRLRDGPLRAVVVHGLPGIGKTTLVCQVLAELAGTFPDVLALRLEGPAAVEPGYALEEINAVLRSRGGGLEPQRLGTESERALGELVEALAAARPAPPLIVLDGGDFARDSWPGTLLEALLRFRELRVVLSSRDRILSAAQAHFVAVPPLEEAEGPEFIRHWATILGLELDPLDVWARVHQLPRSHPQALSTLLSQLVDIPLEMLLESDLPDEVETPARLVARIVSVLPEDARSTLALATLLSSVDLQSALAVLDLDPPRDLPGRLQALLSRSLVRRAGGIYEVPELAAQALAKTDPDTLGRMVERLGAAWRAALAAGLPAARPEVFAAIAPPIAHRLCKLGHATSARRMLGEEFLELLNQRGFWKEYSALVQLAHDTARDDGDRPAQFRLGCRLLRKRVQMGDGERAHTVLAELEGLVDASAGERERAELHSHRALVHQIDHDEAAVERELGASRALREASGDLPGMAMIDKQLGHLLLRRNELSAAAERLAMASAGFAAANDVKNRLDAETSLALCELRTGAAEQADTRLRSVVAECRSAGFEAGLPRAVFHLCLAADKRGRVAEALEHACEAARLAEASGNVVIAQMATVTAGRLAESPAGPAKD